MTARAAATCNIQKTVVASEYFSAFPTDTAKRRSVEAIRSIAWSSDADWLRCTHATRRCEACGNPSGGTSQRSSARASSTSACAITTGRAFASAALMAVSQWSR